MKIDNSSLESVEQFKYLGTTLTNQNSIQEEIKSRLKSGNACYHSVQKLLLSKDLKIKVYRSIILPLVLYGCETWSLTLREEHRLRVVENRVLRRLFGPKRNGVTGEWRKLHNEELNDHYSSPNIVQMTKSRRMRWVGHVACMGERRGVCRVLVGKPGGKNRWRDPGVDGRIILRWLFRKWDVGVWTGSSWLRIEQEAGTCECGNEHSGSIKCGEFLD